MAQQIIVDTGRRAARMAAAAAPWYAAADAITGVTRSIDQMLYEQMQMKEREKQQRLLTTTALATKYSWDALGPDAVSQFEKDSGVTFPRDDTGKPVVPMTFEEKTQKVLGPAMLKKLETDPNAVDIMAGFTQKNPNPQDVELQNRQLDLVKRGQDMDYAIAALKAKAEMAAASRGAKEYAMPSGFVYNPKAEPGSRFEYVGYDKPSMPMYQFNAARSLIDSDVKILEGQKTGLEIQRLQFDLDNPTDPYDKQAADFLQHYDKIPEDKRIGVDAWLKTWAERKGVTNFPTTKKAFSGWVRLLSAATGAAAGGKVAGVKGAVVGGVGGFIAPSLVEGLMPSKDAEASPASPPPVAPPGRFGKGIAPTTQMRATGATPASQARLGSLTDDQLRQALIQERSSGKADIDILQETGNDFRVMKILSELAAGGK